MKQKEKIWALALILSLGLFFHAKNLNEFPLWTHAWAQSDRFAIALGFLDNGFDFFHPQTFVMNKQFPGDFLEPGTTSITAVDFPIHEYIIAAGMKLAQTRDPWVFRCYELLLSFLGLFYFYRLSRLVDNNKLSSLFLTGLVATAPLFTYYQAGFLPGIPSLSISIVGVYYYFKHRKTNKPGTFILSIALFTLAAATRTPFVIPLIAITSMEFLRMIQERKFFWKHWGTLFLGFGFLASYFIYNNHLRAEYGSIFLNKLKPAASFGEAIDIVATVFDTWIYHYFNPIQIVLLAFLITIAILQFLKKRGEFESLSRKLLQFTLISLLGCLFFLFAMLQQFRVHDYYFLDTFFLPGILFFLLLFRYLKSSIESINYSIYLAAGLLVLMVYLAASIQEEKRGTGHWDKIASMVRDYKGLDVKLDSMGISRSATLLVLDSQAPNIPFIRMQRKGFAVVTTSEANLKNALNWKYDYILLQDEWFLSDIFPNYPEIINYMHKVADLGPVSIFKHIEFEKERTLADFYRLNEKPALLKVNTDFETTLESPWEHTETDSTQSFEGKFAGITSPDNEFGITYRSPVTSIFNGKETMLIVSAAFLNPQLAPESRLVVAIDEGGKNVFYKDTPIETLKRERQAWKKSLSLFMIPACGTNCKLSVYIWNRGKNTIHIDNLDISVYSNN